MRRPDSVGAPLLGDRPDLPPGPASLRQPLPVLLPPGPLLQPLQLEGDAGGAMLPQMRLLRL